MTEIIHHIRYIDGGTLTVEYERETNKAELVVESVIPGTENTVTQTYPLHDPALNDLINGLRRAQSRVLKYTTG